MTYPSLLLELILTIGRLFVGSLLIIAGLLKIRAGSQWFLQNILAFSLVKGKLAWFLAQWLPWIEILCGGLLFIGLMVPLITVASFTLLLGFTLVVISTFLRGASVNCGCFGERHDSKSAQVRWAVAYRNFMLTGILVLVYLGGTTSISVDAWLMNLAAHKQYFTFTISTTRWLAVFWSSSLIITICVQILAKNRAFLGNKQLR